METINPFAIYDTLFIGNKLQKFIGDFNSSELQLFCYFSCLLSLYEGNPTSFWGYKFIKNDIGVPLSTDVNDALSCLMRNNEIERHDYYKVTDEGRIKCEILSELNRFQSRTKYLETSCESLLTLPIGRIRSAIGSEPIVKSVSNASLRTLIDDENGAIELLYEQFDLLKEAVNLKDSDLFVPAVTWLKYLQFSEECI